jgi:hypothetical protein
MISGVLKENASMSDTHVPEPYEDIEALNRAVAAVRENIRDLIEQGSAYSGAADDELLSKRIAEQEARLASLLSEQQRLAPDSR